MDTTNYSFAWGFKISLVQKIALAGLFIALACILNKVLAINYISAVPFVRVSFGGPAVIIFASFFLGPIFGGFIGAMSDIVGYLVFDIKAFAWAPSITSTYMLLGIVPSLLFYVLHKIKSINISRILTYSIMGVILFSTSLYIILNDSIVWWGKVHDIALWMKIVFPMGMLALYISLILFIEITYKKQRFNDLPINIFQITLGCFLIEVFIMTLYGSLMKAVLFGMEIFPIILFFQTMTMFFNIPFNVIVLSIIMKATKRYY